MNAADRGPRYPLRVRLERGRVRHMARWLTVAEDIAVTACGKRGRVADQGGTAGVGLCAACATKSNPQDCRSYPTGTTAPDIGMDPFEAADEIDRRWS